MAERVFSMGRLAGAPAGDEVRVREEAYGEGRFAVRSSRGVRSVERVLLERIDRADRGSVLVVRSREGLLAAAVRELFPAARVTAYDWDVHEHRTAREAHLANGIEAVEWELAPVPGAGLSEVHDRILLPLAGDQEVGLSREMIHHSHRLLRVGGLLAVSMDSKRTGPLETYLKKCFSSLACESSPRGRVWFARKKPDDRPPGAPGFASYTIRDGEDVLEFESQAGVFAHGRLDEGTRALLKVVEVRPDETILDLGCGAGELGIVAARRAPAGRVVLVDSNSRAIQVAERNAERWVPGRWGSALTADPVSGVEGKFSLVLANPPYFAHHRISELFLEAATARLVEGGRLYLVTKQAAWHREAIGESMRLVEEIPLLGYTVFVAMP